MRIEFYQIHYVCMYCGNYLILPLCYVNVVNCTD